MSKKKKSNAYDIKKWLKHKKWTKNLSCSPNKEVIFDGVDDFAPMPSTYVSLQDLKKWLGYIFSDEHMDMVRGDHEAMDERRADIYRKIRDADSQWSNNQSSETMDKAERIIDAIHRAALFGEYLPASAHYSFVPAITIQDGCTKMTIETDTITLNPQHMDQPIRIKKKTKPTKAIQFTGSNRYQVMRFTGNTPPPFPEIEDGFIYPDIRSTPSTVSFADNAVLIYTVNGTEKAMIGDFIIKDENGIIRTCTTGELLKEYEILND